jgi:pyrimidine operon attenuation protein/uracil phosphoribosyltransferase
VADEKVVLDGDDMRRTLVRIAHEIVEKNAGERADRLAIVGIHRRGAILARRLHALLSDLLEREVPRGDLDISFYRDDLGRRTEQPVVHSSHLDFAVDGGTVVIVDDVLYTGRTVRAAIEALFDYVGKNLPTALSERVNVHVAELDGTDEVTITSLHEVIA